MKGHVIIGANFGDEGKGLMTDYLADEKSLVVRFNGGAQAGHTVVTSEIENGDFPIHRKRHVFSHFGAGTFKNSCTYLSKFFICNPILFRKELYELAPIWNIPKVYVKGNAPVTLPGDMLINRDIERRRGDSRHGSCGVGINETMTRHGRDVKVTVQDLINYSDIHNNNKFHHYWMNRRDELGFNDPTSEEWSEYSNAWEDFKHACQLFLMNVHIVTDIRILDNFRNIIFEGAQGLLLDEDRLEYFPHVTRSKTGLFNIAHYIYPYFKWESFEVTYMTRSYMTRHGAGPMEGEYYHSDIKTWDKLNSDQTNIHNEFQGYLRHGDLNIEKLIDRCRADLSLIPGVEGNIGMTWCDKILPPGKKELPYAKYLCYGESRQTVREAGYVPL